MKGRLPFAEDFTPIFESFEGVDVSFSEADALKEAFWDLGEPARLREDIRFRQTPWGRWIRSDRWIANDRVLAWMVASGKTECSLDEALAGIPAKLPLVFCTADPRFKLQGRSLSLTGLGKKAFPRPRGRDLSEQGLQGRAEALRKRLLEPPVSRRTTKPDDEEEQIAPGCALALDDDGLRIVIPPLGPDRLPGFVKRLRLLVAPTPIDLLLTRLRSGHEEVVPPSIEPYRWIGFMPDGEEVDDPDLLPILEGLATEGLATGAVTVFRADPDGRAWKQGSCVVEPGGRYRIVFPPDVPVPQGITTTPAALWHDHWRVWELALPLEMEHELAALLKGVGLTLGQPEIGLSWCGDPPSAWTNLRGKPAPVFDTRDRIAVHLTEMPEAAGELVALLVGVANTVWVTLDRSLPIIRCDALPAGPYVLEIVARDLAVTRVRVWFEVREDAGAPPRAEVNILWKAANEVFPEAPEGDFRLLGGDLSEILIAAPPCWPVTLRWHGLDQSHPVLANADRDGLLVGAFSQLREGATRDIHARLDVSFAELGSRRFEHLHPPREDELHALLVDLLPKAARGLPRDIRVLKQLWFEPLLRPLGFKVGDPTADEASGAVCWSLLSMVETETGLRPRATALLLLVPDGVDVASEQARQLANQHAPSELRRVLVTDGLRWRRLLRRQIPGPAFHLTEAVDDGRFLTVALEALTPEIA